MVAADQLLHMLEAVAWCCCWGHGDVQDPELPPGHLASSFAALLSVTHLLGVALGDPKITPAYPWF